MSCDSSDSEYDSLKKRVLEAVDFSILNSSIFKEPATCPQDAEKKSNQISQRYFTVTDKSKHNDCIVPHNTQKFMIKKFSKIVQDEYEFYDVSITTKPILEKSYCNQVRLLEDAKCYVQAYEDFEYKTKSTKIPEIKRRIIDNDNNGNLTKKDLKSIAVDSAYILDGRDMRHWAWREHSKKVYHYEKDANGVLHSKEPINEFTSIRISNNWNESMINKSKKRLQ